MWGGRLGGARANSRNLTKLLDRKARGTLSEPRLNLADANVALKRRITVSYLVAL